MLFFFASINDQILPDTHPKRILLILKVGTDMPKQFRFWNWPRALGGSGSGSRTDWDILAVPGPVLKDFCPRVRFSGTWTDQGTTLTYIVSWKSLSVHVRILGFSCCQPPIQNHVVCCFCFGWIYKTELGRNFWCCCVPQHGLILINSYMKHLFNTHDLTLKCSLPSESLRVVVEI